MTERWVKMVPPPDAQAMTREQVEDRIDDICDDCIAEEAPGYVQELKDTDAALRETIRRLEEHEKFVRQEKDTLLQQFCNLQVSYGEQKHTIRDLQARLTASEAKVKEMEQACDQRKLTRKQLIEFDKIIGLRDREINTLRDRLARKTLKWTTARPTVAGWYWFRNTAWPDESDPRIIYVRDYAGHLAIGNCRLEGFKLYETGEFQGPLTPGEE